MSGSPKKFSGSRSENHTQFQFQVTCSKIWLIIPIPDYFLPKNIFLKILVLVPVWVLERGTKLCTLDVVNTVRELPLGKLLLSLVRSIFQQFHAILKLLKHG